MNWTSCTLGDVITLQRGHDLPEGDRKSGDIPVIGSAGPNGFHNIARQNGPGVTVGRSGASIGKVTYVSQNYWPHNTCLYVKDFKGNDPRFIAYFLSRQNLAQLNSGAAQPSLNRNFVHAVKVRIPDPQTQERLASVLSAYDDLIENNRRRIALLEEAARLLYREWFVRLRFPGYEQVRCIDGVPEKWELGKLSDFVEVLSGGTPKTTEPSYWGDDIPFFTPKDTGDYPYTFDTEKMITESGLKNCNSRLYRKNTVFITARGTVGKVRLAQRPMAMNQSCYALLGTTHLTQEFLYFAISDKIDQFRNQAVGAVFDAIVVDTFKRISFLVPEKNVAADFSEIAERTLRQIDVLSAQIRELIRARDFLLPRLMDGRLEI